MPLPYEGGGITTFNGVIFSELLGDRTFLPLPSPAETKTVSEALTPELPFYAFFAPQADFFHVLFCDDIIILGDK